MKYRDLMPISREEFAAAMAAPSPEAAGEALLRLALHEPDGDWAEQQAMNALHDPRLAVQRAAVISLGHIARIHGSIGLSRVIPTLRQLRANPELAGVAEDALDDIQTFAQQLSY